MLVLKNKGTNSFLKSEKKSLYRFFIPYTSILLLVLTLLSVYYYQSQEKLMLAQQRASLTKYAYIQTKRLKVLHHFFDDRRDYPRDLNFKSAIYDNEYHQIFSLLEEKTIDFDQEIYLTKNHIHFIKILDNYYLGAKYLIVEIKDDGLWRQDLWKNILIYGAVFFLLFLFVGLYFAKLFLKPMRDSIVLLDRFIKDTTHELNTPLSAILANVEMMDTEVMIEKNKKKLNRINIAAKTVSILYQDLIYLTLEQEQKNDDEPILLQELIENRIEYFMILAESKNISFQTHLSSSTLYADRRKITRVIDNLLSNAIKYNKREGTVGIELQEHMLCVWDTGIGVEPQDIQFMFDRYIRFNQSEGGFGIGLNIVKSILDEYKITIEIKSEKNKGTKMVLRW